MVRATTQNAATLFVGALIRTGPKTRGRNKKNVARCASLRGDRDNFSALLPDEMGLSYNCPM